jgi:hypothetical protein
VRGERRGMAGMPRTPLIVWNLDCVVRVVVRRRAVSRPPAPHLDAAPVKAPLRIAGLLFCC